MSQVSFYTTDKEYNYILELSNNLLYLKNKLIKYDKNNHNSAK